MKICILDIGKPPEGLEQTHGLYDHMFKRDLTHLAAPYQIPLEFTSVYIHQGQSLPNPTHADAYLITGASEAVYEDHDWVEPLCDFIRTLGRQKIPLIGICFGHQIIAHAHGGVVEKSAKGWGIGLHTHHLHADIIQKFIPTSQSLLQDQSAPYQFSCMASHQDQVITPPSSASVLGGSDFCPNGALIYHDFPVLSFQRHPEFDLEFSRALIECDEDISPDLRCDALNSLTPPSSPSALGRDFIFEIILLFLQQHRQ